MGNPQLFGQYDEESSGFLTGHPSRGHGHATLFDARMGNVDCGQGMRAHCTTCRSIELHRQSSDAPVSLARIPHSTDEWEAENPRCTGHYGKIDLPIPLVHPLLQGDALLILNSGHGGGPPSDTSIFKPNDNEARPVKHWWQLADGRE